MLVNVKGKIYLKKIWIINKALSAHFNHWCPHKVYIFSRILTLQNKCQLNSKGFSNK